MNHWLILFLVTAVLFLVHSEKQAPVVVQVTLPTLTVPVPTPERKVAPKKKAKPKPAKRRQAPRQENRYCGLLPRILGSCPVRG
jgi:hypothetical protein